MTWPQPHSMRMPVTRSPSFCSVTTGSREEAPALPGGEDGEAAAAVAHEDGAWERIGVKAGAVPAVEPALRGTRGTKSVGMEGGVDSVSFNRGPVPWPATAR